MIKDTTFAFQLSSDDFKLYLKPEKVDYYLYEFIRHITKQDDLATYTINNSRYINLAILISFTLGMIILVLGLTWMAQITAILLGIRIANWYRTKHINREFFKYSVKYGILPDTGRVSAQLLSDKVRRYNNGN